MKEILETSEASPERTSLLSELAAIDINSSTHQERKPSQGRLIIPPHVWQRRVQDLVAQIIVPDLVTWMDDDDGLSVPQLAQRALFELHNRFEGYVITGFIRVQPKCSSKSTRPS